MLTNRSDGGKDFVLRGDEKLTAFVNLPATIQRRFETQMESHA
jgi:hypothetical protein